MFNFTITRIKTHFKLEIQLEKYYADTKIPLKLRPEISDREIFYFDSALDDIIKRLRKNLNQLEKYKIYLVNFEHLSEKDDDKKLLLKIHATSMTMKKYDEVLAKLNEINRCDYFIRRYKLSEESFLASKDKVLSTLENSRISDVENFSDPVLNLKLPQFDQFLDKISVCYPPLSLISKSQIFTILSKTSLQSDFFEVLRKIFPGIESLECQEISSSTETVQRISAVRTSDGGKIPIHSIFLQKNLQLDVFCAKLESQIKIGCREIFKTGLKTLLQDQTQVYSLDFWKSLNPPGLIAIVLLEVFSSIFPLEKLKLKSLRQDLEGQPLNLQILSGATEFSQNHPEENLRYCFETAPTKDLFKGNIQNLVENRVCLGKVTILTLKRPIALAPHTPVAQKIADQR